MKIKIGGSAGKLAEDAKKAVKKNPGAAAGMVALSLIHI